jgi:carbon monoxide dehydrogenase subunit G
MRSEKEFTVAAPLGRVWQTLSDVEAIVSCLPGVELRAADAVRIGRVALVAGGSRLSCEVTARSIDKDEDEHVATIGLHARQLDGPATGSATVQSQLTAIDGSTRVVLSAEWLFSGHEGSDDAEQGVACQLLDAVAEGVEQRVLAPMVPPRPEQSAAGPQDKSPVLESDSGAIPVGPLGGKVPPARLVIAAGGLLLVLAVRLTMLVRRRRRASGWA